MVDAFAARNVPLRPLLGHGLVFAVQLTLSKVLLSLPHDLRDGVSLRFRSFLPWLSASQLFLLTCTASVAARGLLRRGVLITRWTETDLDDKALRILQSEISPQGGSMSSRLSRAAHIAIAFYFSSLPLHGQFKFLRSGILRTAVSCTIAWRMFTVVWQLILWFFGEALPSSGVANEHGLDEESIRALLRVARPVYWTLACLLVGENAGFKVGSLIASAGVGGIAVAMSSQQILQDILAAFTMLLDKTVSLGDYVDVGGDIRGTVISRGWKSTRLQSPAGYVSVVANRDICGSRIKSYAPKQDRLEVVRLRLDLQTDIGKLPDLAQVFEKAVDGTNGKFRAAHLKSFEDCAIVFEIVVVFEDSSLGDYWQGLHEVNVALAKALHSHNIKFAVPYRKRL